MDHRNGTVQFGAMSLESDRLKGHLGLLSSRLATALRLADPTPPADLESKRLQVGTSAAVLRISAYGVGFII